ncbi:MAG TPA: O-methyltransferase [Chthoniobacteraceae bacterium]|nr:O-methyltransferase [Chthoniobacteraceae bacterium]
MRKYTPVTDDLYDYMTRQRSQTHDPVMDALRAETATLGEVSQMSVSEVQGSFLTLFVAAVGAKHAVEVGTFTGASSISIARGLPPDGRLICFDRDDQWTSIAVRYWKQAGVADKIELRLGDAATTLGAFKPSAPLDFVFIDANKDGYDQYYEALLPHVRAGGVIIFDNMFRHGEVLWPAEKQSIETRTIDALNHKLAADPRVQSVLIPIADGLNICRKKSTAGEL